jgi:nucleotide-binding universal stress UspA family protein
MTTLVPIDGSQSSMEAMKYAARMRPEGDLLLLYVAPSGRQADLERGRYLLDGYLRACRGLAEAVRVRTRLEVGEARAKLPEVAAEAGCDLVVMGAHGVNALPHVDPLGENASEWSEEVQRPVVLVLPTGRGVRAPSHQRTWEEEPVAGRV